MSKTEDLAKLETSIKEAETRLKSIQTSVEAIALEIRKVVVIEKTLIENVNILKKQQIIAIAQEFKKAKEELSRVQTRLIVLRNDQAHIDKASQEVNVFLQNARIQHNKMLVDGENNVLKFRRRDGKK